MAEESKKKPESKAKTGAAKPAAKAAEKPAAKPAVTEGAHCRADKCRQPVRAKGYCRKHYIAWRRGETGDHHRYKVCSKEGCRKPRAKGGLCDEHAGTAAPAGAPAEAAAGGGGATA